MVARLSSVWVIALLIPSQPLLMHVGKLLAAMSDIKRSAGVAPEVSLRECTLHSHPQKSNEVEPTLALKPRGDVTKNPKQRYQRSQNRTCVCVHQKHFLNFFFYKRFRFIMT